MTLPAFDSFKGGFDIQSNELANDGAALAYDSAYWNADAFGDDQYAEVDSSYTYRQILRMVGGLFMFAQRHHGKHLEALIDSTAQLDLRWNQIPPDRRQRIRETADSLGYVYDDITNTWTIRQVLKYLSDQWGDTPILFGFVTL